MTRREALAALVAAGGAGWSVVRVRAGQRDSFDGRLAGDERLVDVMPLRWCPPGTFLMGSPEGESGRRADEAQVSVTLTRGFWIGAFEVTQSQWRDVMARPTARPLEERFGLGDDVPVYWVNYMDAEAFCARLTERARRADVLPPGWAFRLPTEAQWEYACRAGTTTATAFGDRLGRDQANFSGAPLGDGIGGLALGKSAPVGRYPSNAWGIADMHGNVFEWCRDWYHARLPGGTDPDLSAVPGVQNGDGSYSRVRRGGAWNDPGMYCRSAMRLRYEPERSSDHIGFRVVAERTAR